MDNKIIITCEHAGNQVPDDYKHLFREDPGILQTHRGYDIGAKELTQTIAGELQVTPHLHSVTRLLVDLNRSRNSSELFSEFVEPLDKTARDKVLNDYYQPHRNSVEQIISEAVGQDLQVVHVSVHTFTPRLNGQLRDVDIGLLFDPDRPAEKRFCKIWRQELDRQTDLKVQFNYPYPGVMDGFSTYLRTKFDGSEYVGLEVEVNQKFAREQKIEQWNGIRRIVAVSLRKAYESWR
ncbi:MAG: N-formylglutamate amidohydrolase [Balneolaceae bacterium]|nr:N-formylglutamate amidohydrolase [Balneolaceae bacterium]